MLKLPVALALIALSFSLPAREREVLRLRQQFKILILQSVSSKVETLRIAIEDSPEIAEKTVEILFPYLVKKIDFNGDGFIDADDIKRVHAEIVEYYKTYIADSFVDYEIEPNAENFLRALDKNEDGQLSLSELQDLVVKKTESPVWNMAIQYFVQGFDTEDTFKGFLSPTELEAMSKSLIGEFMSLDEVINKTVKHPKEPLPAKGSETEENRVEVDSDFVEDESAAAYFLRIRMKTLEYPVQFQKNSILAWQEFTKIMDLDKNGFIDQADVDRVWSELKPYIERHIESRSVSGKFVQSPEEWFRAFDVSGNGRLEWEEFEQAMQLEASPAAHTFQAFFVKHLDQNGDGALSNQEKESFLSSALAPLLQLRPRSIAETRIADQEMERREMSIDDEEMLTNSEILVKEETPVAADESLESNEGRLFNPLNNPEGERPEVEIDSDDLSPEQLQEPMMAVVNKMEMLRMRFATPGNFEAAREIIRANYDMIVESADFNGDGILTSSELSQAWEMTREYMEEKLGRQVVDREEWLQKLGAQADGSVKLAEGGLLEVMTSDLQGKMWESFIACLFNLEIDTNRDGQLSRAEYEAFKASDFHRLFELPTMKPEDNLPTGA